MTPDEAADLAARTLAAIDAHTKYATDAVRNDHRERVASDAVGIREHAVHHKMHNGLCHTCRRYADGLRRTAALYGEQP